MDKSETKETLKNFIHLNHELLSTMAILVAISTFTTNISIHWLASTISFISIAGVVTVWFELNAQIPKQVTARLFLFRYTLLWGLAALIFYWLLAFREFWNIFLFIPIFFLIFLTFISTLEQLKEIQFIRKIFGIGIKKNIWQNIFCIAYGFFIYLGFFWCLQASIVFSPVFNWVLEIVKLNFK